MRNNSGRTVVGLLSDGVPRSLRQIQLETGIGYKPVESTLWRLYRGGQILRNVHPFRENNLQRKGRGGSVRNLRNYFLYTLRPNGIDKLELEGQLFCVSQPRPVGQIGTSKAKKIRAYLQDNVGTAYFSKELVERLAVKPSDIMRNIAPQGSEMEHCPSRIRKS
jgi:hypothetical protein